MSRKRLLTVREILLLVLPILAVALFYTFRRFYKPSATLSHPIVGVWQLEGAAGARTSRTLAGRR